VFRDIRRESFGEIPPQKIFRAVKSIGGDHGWFRFDLLWRIRGLMDKLAGGFGYSVGRRTESNLRVGDTLVQTAYHFPKGLLGRLYWYSMLPFHAFIFPDMIRSIVRQAGRMA
jgi:hypothetical protein